VLGAWGLGLRVQGLGFAPTLGFRISGFGFRIRGLDFGFWVCDAGFRNDGFNVSGLGFRAVGLRSRFKV